MAGLSVLEPKRYQPVPDHLLDVVEQGNLETGRFPNLGGGLQKLLRQPGECAEADHLHPVMMSMPRRPYRSAETPDDTDGKTIGAKYRRRDLRRSQAVLDGLDDRLRTQQRKTG